VLIVVVAFVALVGFAMVLAELTLTPSPASADIVGSNLRPGHSLRQYAEDYTFLAACKQIGGNLLMGAPFGLILPVLVSRRLRMIRVVLLTAVVMVLVELAQGSLIEGRAFDVDDVILNTSGALIAYLWLGRRIGRRFHALGVPVPAASEPVSEDGAELAPAAKGRARWVRSPGRAVMTKRTATAGRTARKAEQAAAKGEPVVTRPVMSKQETKPGKPGKTKTGSDEDPTWSGRLSRLTRR
jgi:VanZ family protein